MYGSGNLNDWSISSSIINTHHLCCSCFKKSSHLSLNLKCITRVWIIVHLSCGSASHFFSCMFPLCLHLMTQCDQVEVIPIPSVCMTPHRSLCLWSCMPHEALLHRALDPPFEVDSDALWLMPFGCLHALRITPLRVKQFGSTRVDCAHF